MFEIFHYKKVILEAFQQILALEKLTFQWEETDWGKKKSKGYSMAGSDKCFGDKQSQGRGEGESQGASILNRTVRGGPSEKATFESKLERGERGSSGAIEGREVQAEGPAGAKALRLERV